eukprot:TRINITY_DN2919_c0_g2_i1.p1 TRINITY_DN2919_c0_g2~~TRINITY_DN2919_c0_g2_i1.p1  ORF type:complete len:414 (-),score=100.67 TRINITY_DN2919_c0_g2_i1:28-1245(-)
MSVLLKCSLLGEQAVFGCGVSTAANEIAKELEQDSEIRIDQQPALSTRLLSQASSRHAKSEKGAFNGSRSPLGRMDSEWFSCEDEADLLKKFAKSSEVEHSEESTTLPEESEIASGLSGEKTAEEALSKRPTLFAAPRGMSSASSVEQERVDELWRRLSDILGPDGNAYDKESVEKLGGYPTCLWRFLVSVNNNIDAAEAKLRKTMEFRRGIDANGLLENSPSRQIFDNAEQVWPEVNLGTTSDGSPVSYFDIQKAVKFLQLGYDEDAIRSIWLVWMERSNAIQRAGRSAASGSISSLDMPGTVVVYNLEGMRLSQLTSCLSGLHQFCRVLGLAEQHYPTNLRKAIILNSPSMFSRMVWPLVQKVLDAETLSNVLVCDGDNYAALTSEELGFGTEELGKLLEGRL